MNAPKLLPWFARKAGLSDASALQLWSRASEESEMLCARSQSTDLHATTLSRFISLIEAQSGATPDGGAIRQPARQRPSMQHASVGLA